MAQLRIGVVYGGRSREHEVSLASAASVISHLDPSKYEPVPIRIDRDGRWFFDHQPPTATSAEQIIKEIKSRLTFLVNVGLDYLTMNRSASTLSGGESQRIRLATQIGSQLMGVLYILDEPTIGLHQRDNERLIQTLYQLRDLGNTIIVVEHDENTIRASDWVLDMGPKAGRHGGKIVATGTPENIMKNTMPERKPLLSTPGTDLGAPRLKSCPKHEGSMAQREAYGSRDADIVSELETRDPTGHRLASADQPAPRTRGGHHAAKWLGSVGWT